MTTTVPDPAAPARASGPGTLTRHGTWRLTWHGVRTVAALELRQRVRSTRWVWALVVFFVVVGGLTLLASGAIGSTYSSVGVGGQASDPSLRGPLLFAVVVFLVLGLGLLVTPTLSSTAINGDRNAGTLATLQVTLLSPAEIVVGKLLAAWLTSLAFLVTASPFLAYALAVGRTPVLSFFLVLLIVAVLLACVCGMGLGFSALTARSAGSTVLTFVAVAALTILTPILFAVTYPSITTTEDVTVLGVDPSYQWDSGERPTCELRTENDVAVTHTERTWWLLGVNPFVIIADGAGTSGDSASSTGSGETAADPLAELRRGVRELRAGPAETLDWCYSGVDGAPVSPTDRHVDTSPVWPWGLGVHLLLGLGGVTLAIHRLRIPQRTLARGTRVA